MQRTTDTCRYDDYMTGDSDKRNDILCSEMLQRVSFRAIRLELKNRSREMRKNDETTRMQMICRQSQIKLSGVGGGVLQSEIIDGVHIQLRSVLSCEMEDACICIMHVKCVSNKLQKVIYTSNTKRNY